MSDAGGHGSGTSSVPGALDPVVDALVDRAVPRVVGQLRHMVREELERIRAELAAAEWLTPKEACARAGWRSTSTVREKFKAGVLTRGRRGRVNARELDAYLGSREGAASATSTTVDLRDARARRAAAEILAGGKRGGRNQ